MLKVDSCFVDWISQSANNMSAFFRDCLELFHRTSLPIDTVYRVSVVALSVQLLHRDCLLPLLQQNQHESLSWQQSALVLYVLPILTTIISFSISVTLLLQWHPIETVVVIGLVALLVVECLVPLAIAACTGLALAQAMTWDSALIVLVTVWITSTISSRCIRVALYPTLGHGY
jgi:hypothetical protein